MPKTYAYDKLELFMLLYLTQHQYLDNPDTIRNPKTIIYRPFDILRLSALTPQLNSLLESLDNSAHTIIVPIDMGLCYWVALEFTVSNQIITAVQFKISVRLHYQGRDTLYMMTSIKLVKQLG